MIYSESNGVGSSSLGGGPSGDNEQAVSPVFCREIGSGLALDGMAKLAYC